MTEDSCPRVSSSESDSLTTKQRKKRKWDQPDESLVSTVPRIFPLTNVGPLAAMTLHPISSITGVSHHMVPLVSSAAPQIMVPMPLQQHAAAVVQKLVQPKIQDELIAREIVINDADSAIRYKLTKRQTQEEIQRSTGAVVITRGKYRPSNASPDGERPLYLHISAAAHLETTAERIKAVDLAAAMVEEMLRQGPLGCGTKVDHLLSTCIFLGFEADASMEIASRVRGPNDQFINHIVKETGANVLLRGRGSGHFEDGETEETQQPFHLLLSCNDAKSLERAKLLAENLLDTISAECGALRFSSTKLYGVVPPPPQLQVGVESPLNISTANGATVPTDTSKPIAFPVLIPGSIGSTNLVPHIPNTAFYSPTLTSGTSYIGYGGIYPQATPLQQVAQVLRQSSASPVTATLDSTITSTSLNQPPKENAHAAKERRPQKRKFQELPAGANRPESSSQKNLQGSEFSMPRELTSHVGARDDVIQDPKKLVLKQARALMPPPLPRSLSPPSPPPKLNSTLKPHGDSNMLHKSKSEHVPDTLTKLMEYGDDDDDDDDEQLEGNVNGLLKNHSSVPSKPKPFWAV